MEGGNGAGRLRTGRDAVRRPTVVARVAVLVPCLLVAASVQAQVHAPALSALPPVPGLGLAPSPHAASGIAGVESGLAFMAHVAPSVRVAPGDLATSWFGIGEDAGIAEGRALDAIRWRDVSTAWVDSRSVADLGEVPAVGVETGMRGAAPLAGAALRASQAPVGGGDAARWLAGLGLVVLLAWRKLSDPRNRL